MKGVLCEFFFKIDYFIPKNNPEWSPNHHHRTEALLTAQSAILGTKNIHKIWDSRKPSLLSIIDIIDPTNLYVIALKLTLNNHQDFLSK